MIAVNEEQRLQLLEDVIGEIQTMTVECKWFISSEKISELLAISKEEFHRVLYSFRDHVHYKSGVHGGFSEADGDALVNILSKILHLNCIDERFSQAGIFFSSNQLDSMRAGFVDYIDLILRRHETDKDLLLLLVSATLHFDDAYDSYFDDKIDLEQSIRRFIDEFTENNCIDTSYGAEVLLRDYLIDLLKKNRIELRKITSEHRERLHYDLYGNFRKKKTPKKPKVKSRLQILLEFFSLEEGATMSELKKRYKDMLKEYHPDVNREGLEMTQKIVASYKELITII